MSAEQLPNLIDYTTGVSMTGGVRAGECHDGPPLVCGSANYAIPYERKEKA